MTSHSTSLADGTVMHEGVLHVPWETEAGAGLARIVPDGKKFRLRLDDGTAGPVVTRQTNGQWHMDDGPDNYAPGSVLAQIVAKKVTTDARTLHHAASIMESMGLPESVLANNDPAPAAQAVRQHFQATVMMAVGQAFVETLPKRLRDPNASAWSPDEVRIIVPDLARQIDRPIAIYGNDRFLDVAVGTDGTPIPGDAIPSNALRLYRDYANRYEGPRDHVYPNIFAAVEPATRSPGSHRAMDPAHQEHLFRTELATAIEAAPMQARLTRMHERWLNPHRDHIHKWQLKGFSRLRQALFDPHHPLDAGDERSLILLLQTILPSDQRIAVEVMRHGHPGERLAFFDTSPAATNRIVIEADLDSQGRRSMYYRQGTAGNGPFRSRPIHDNLFSPIIDVLLNADNGKIRTALALSEWDFQTFADRLLAKTINGSQTRLLPASLQRLVVTDPTVLADAKRHTGDSWIFAGRHYVRLRDLPGNTQIIETHAPAPDGSRTILGYNDTLSPPEQRLPVLHQRKGIWSPSWLLKTGLDPLSASFRQDAAAAIVDHLPPGAQMDTGTALRIAEALPFSTLAAFMTYPAPIQIGPQGELMIRNAQVPGKAYRTRFDLSGQPVAITPPIPPALPPRPATPLTRHQELMPALRLRDISAVPGATTPPASADIATFNDLLASGQPVGEFITRGVVSPHIRALISTRQLRGVLSENEYMILVGTAGTHAFTVAMPINEASIRLTQSASGAVSFTDLPPGTRIIDDWYGVSATLADYPDQVRAIAGQWARNGQEMVMHDGSVSSAAAFTEDMLSTPVKFNYWSPVHDPINEARYLDYIYERYARPRPVEQAGRDWLDTAAARAEYARYFPNDAAGEASVARVGELAGNAPAPDAPSAGTSTASASERPSVIILPPDPTVPPGSP